MYVHLQQVDKILIGQITVDSKADWETLQNTICSVFKVSRLRRCELAVRSLIGLVCFLLQNKIRITKIIVH